jgi:hypothetical protein
MQHGGNGDFEWLTSGPSQSVTQGTESVQGNKRRSIK